MIKGKFQEPPEALDNSEFRELIEQLLSDDPRERRSVKELLDHPWLEEDEDHPVSSIQDIKKEFAAILEAIKESRNATLKKKMSGLKNRRLIDKHASGAHKSPFPKLEVAEIMNKDINDKQFKEKLGSYDPNRR